jgi:hypothetical protein
MSSIKNSPEYIWSLICDSQLEEAYKLLTGMQDGSVWMQNAMAVCQMRMGKPEKACAILIDLVYQKNSVVLRADATDATKLNLATAMLMTGNIEGALGVFNSVKNETPMKKNVEYAIQIWKKKQSLCSRIGMLFGMYPSTKAELDFPPGQIEVNLKNKQFIH